MEKVDKLAPGDLAHTISAYKSYSKLSESISNRMNYIIRFCVEKVKGKLSWWDWQNGGEGGDRAPGEVVHSYTQGGNSLQITGEWTHGSRMIFLDKDGGEWDLSSGDIPERWLHEDFEEEYTKGLQLYQEQQAQTADKRKAAVAQRKQAKAALVASASAKLSPEEKKALGIK